MANYLLLRNNKESGPYSLDDLMELGLKPYDLVWIQGRSAAWRYPSEVDELKPFAPMVEEQPFDRFYKKQKEEKKEVVIKQEAEATIAPEHEKYIPKKSVFVTMPGQKAGNYTKPIIKEETYKLPVPDPIPETISITENPVAAQLKYSQPLDEIKEMYVKTLHERKQKIARKGFWLQGLKKAAVIFLLVAFGLIAGFFIRSNGSAKQETIAGNKPSQPAPATTESLVSLPEANIIQQQDAKIIPPPTGGYVNEPTQRMATPAESKQPAIKYKPGGSDIKNETVLSLSQKEDVNAMLTPGVEMDPATGERSRKVRTETNNVNGNSTTKAEKRSVYSGELGNMVSVTSNEYKKVAFGGIRNLELTITNDSKYTLDNVIVELQYLKPNELPLKTENIEFKSVASKATSTVRVPDTNRGIKVVYRIINIKSRQMDEIASGN
ncbi:MAG: hypothetical protein WDO16_07595 [Bacteroidota bacterium]